MSQIDFANLTNEFPRFTSAWRFMANWLSTHPRVRQIELDRLATDGESIDAGQLSAAIEILLDRGLFERRVGFKDPDGMLLNSYPEDPSGRVAIPDRIPARDHSTYYNRNDLDITEVYEVNDI